MHHQVWSSQSINPMALNFTIIPKKQQLITPALSTPREVKPLSDIDDQQSLRCHFSTIMFYKNNNLCMDPVKIIRESLAKTLVFYYPFAGRLIQGPDNKLMVDCTSEGVVFVEADAAVGLDELGDSILPPCPYPELLLCDVSGSDWMLAHPLMSVQVTRFKCGGFVLAILFNHVIGDGLGAIQFVKAMSEIAKGAPTPSILPQWKRDLLTATQPPRVTRAHPEYDSDEKSVMPSCMHDKTLVKRSFTFGPEEIGALRKNLPPEAGQCSKFELITACLWRSRTRALQFDSNDNVRITCAVDIRRKSFVDLPEGYYGNAVIFPAKASKVKALSEGPVGLGLGYAIKLVQEAKKRATRDYFESSLAFIATNGRPKYLGPWNFAITDASKAGFDEVDFGWGKPIYGGTMNGGTLNNTIYARYRNKKGEEVLVMPVILPVAAMKRFENELRTLIHGPSKL